MWNTVHTHLYWSGITCSNHSLFLVTTANRVVSGVSNLCVLPCKEENGVVVVVGVDEFLQQAYLYGGDSGDLYLL